MNLDYLEILERLETLLLQLFLERLATLAIPLTLCYPEYLEFLLRLEFLLNLEHQ